MSNEEIEGKSKILKFKNLSVINTDKEKPKTEEDLFIITSEEGKVSFDIKVGQHSYQRITLTPQKAATLGLMLVVAARNTIKKD